MKTIMTLAILLGSTAAFAQEERKGDELRREFEKSMKALQERFDAERAKLEREFKAARQKSLEKGEAPPEGRREERRMEPGRPGDPLERMRERLDRLEKRLDEALPRMRDGLQRFEFKLPEGLPLHPPGDWRGYQERLRKWVEQMPKPEFRSDEEQPFEFRRAPKKPEKPDKKDNF